MSTLTIALGPSVVQSPDLWRKNERSPFMAQSRPVGEAREVKDDTGYVARLMWMSLHKVTAEDCPDSEVLYPVCDEINVEILGLRCLHFGDVTTQGLFVPRRNTRR